MKFFVIKDSTGTPVRGKNRRVKEFHHKSSAKRTRNKLNGEDGAGGFTVGRGKEHRLGAT